MDTTKQAGLVIPEAKDLPTIGRYALGGAAVGGGAAALLSLVHQLKLQRQLAKEQYKLNNPTETDENTIVLTLPPKQGESSDVKDAGPMSQRLLRMYARRGEDPKTGKPNQLPPDEKQANDPSTFAMSMLAMLGGGTGAYSLVRNLYHKSLMKEIKEKEEAARTAVMDQMTMKGASSTFSYLDAPIGFAVLMSLLSAGGAGFITKKVMDERYREADRTGYEPPKTTRVVFRSQPVPANGELSDGEKVASAEDIDALRGAIVVHMIKASGDESVFDDADVKAAMSEAKLDKQAIMGAADTPTVDLLLSHMLQNRGVSSALQNAWMQDKHPLMNKVFGWTRRVPGLRGIWDKMMYSRLGLQPAPQVPLWGPAGIKPPAAPTAQFGLKQGMFGLPTPSGIANSVIGSMMAERVGDEEKPRVVQVEPAKPAPTPEDVAGKIRLTAKDPAARAFLEAKKARIRQLLIELAAQPDKPASV